MNNVAMWLAQVSNQHPSRLASAGVKHNVAMWRAQVSNEHPSRVASTGVKQTIFQCG